MIRAVLFDLDGTLYDRDVVVRSIVNDQLATILESRSSVDGSRLAARVLELDSHGYCLTREVYATVAREFDLGTEMIDILVNHFWENFERFCTLADDVKVTLETLRKRRLKLGIITNGSVDRQAAKISTLGLAGFFDTVLISQREGLQKPDPRIFQRALEQCGVNAEEAMFVGDHPEMDVAGARSAGLVPVWKRVPYWEMTTEGVVTIDRLSEVLPLCVEST